MEIIVSKLIELAKELGRQEIKAEFFEEKFHASNELIKGYIEQKSELQAQVFQLTAENAELKEQLAKLKENFPPAQNDASFPEIPAGFIRHDGGGNPVANKPVMYATRNGYQPPYPVSSEYVFWVHKGRSDDIIAYKVIED